MRPADRYFLLLTINIFYQVMLICISKSYTLFLLFSVKIILRTTLEISALWCALTHSLRNFWHPFSRSVRNYFVDARKNHGYGYKNWYISVTNNIARHKICTSLDL